MLFMPIAKKMIESSKVQFAKTRIKSLKKQFGEYQG